MAGMPSQIAYMMVVEKSTTPWSNAAMSPSFNNTDY